MKLFVRLFLILMIIFGVQNVSAAINDEKAHSFLQEGYNFYKQKNIMKH